jgi:hypothetical protein
MTDYFEESVDDRIGTAIDSPDAPETAVDQQMVPMLYAFMEQGLDYRLLR